MLRSYSVADWVSPVSEFYRVGFSQKQNLFYKNRGILDFLMVNVRGCFFSFQGGKICPSLLSLCISSRADSQSLISVEALQSDAGLYRKELLS